MTDTTTSAPAAPTTEQLVTAFAQALLPFAGPYGVAAAAVIPAAEAFVDNMKGLVSGGAAVFTMADLEGVAAKTTADLNALAADIEASKG